MKIGVISIGAIGGTITRELVAHGHAVHVANSRGADAAKDFAGEIGATPIHGFPQCSCRGTIVAVGGMRGNRSETSNYDLTGANALCLASWTAPNDAPTKSISSRPSGPGRRSASQTALIVRVG
jgi:hypothetical protein